MERNAHRIIPEDFTCKTLLLSTIKRRVEEGEGRNVEKKMKRGHAGVLLHLKNGTPAAAAAAEEEEEEQEDLYEQEAVVSFFFLSE